MEVIALCFIAPGNDCNYLYKYLQSYPNTSMLIGGQGPGAIRLVSTGKTTNGRQHATGGGYEGPNLTNPNSCKIKALVQEFEGNHSIILVLLLLIITIRQNEAIMLELSFFI